MDKLGIDLKIDTLTCHEKGKARGKRVPYLWTIFFKIDGSAIKVTKEFKVAGKADFHLNKKSHGNLYVEGVEEGEIISVPDDIGRWKTELAPVQVPFFNARTSGMIGVICVLMQENNISNAGAEAGHQALNRFVQETVNTTLAEFEPAIVNLDNVEGSVKRYFSKKFNDSARDFVSTIGVAVRKNQNLIQNIWSRINRDDLIGYVVWYFNYKEISLKSNFIGFVKRWKTEIHGDWELQGRLIAKVKHSPEEVIAKLNPKGKIKGEKPLQSSESTEEDDDMQNILGV